ncbi:APC family permease [Trueperella bialowiezensis]|uniref:Amino acid permease n=1 Tax=Trueperella bialowiezensis TaxID=312285 RepID=A0A3S4VEN3_9ACTO|nr:APC family permease [Trueperella bialowiezensis]VEI12504.1 Uncharacterised protein [Trueperella bialowiezensis]
MAVIVPQIVLRAMSYSQRSTGALVALVVGFITTTAALWFSRRMGEQAPRRPSHQLAERNIARWAAFLVAAARIFAYSLLIILGIELAVTAVETVTSISWGAWLDPILILVVAVPALLGWARKPRLIMLCAGLALIMLGALLVYGLVQEAIGAIDFENIRLARKEAYSTPGVYDDAWPFVEAAVGGAALGAVASLISERILDPQQNRWVPAKTMARLMAVAFLAVAVTLYFVVALKMPGHRVAIPSLSMAYAFFGPGLQAVLAAVYALLGLCVASASYGQLPRLLRELALDGLLPRRLQAADAVMPRRLIIATISVLAAVVTLVLDSTRSVSLVFVLTMYIVVAMTCLAMVARARRTLQVSVDSVQRKQARVNAWAFGAYALLAITVVIAVIIARPKWAFYGSAALLVPVIFLMTYARGQDKREAQLELASISAGRTLPTRVHGVVIIERVDEAAIQAVTWARALRLSSLTAIAVDVNPAQTDQIRTAWKEAMIPVDLTILGEPQGALRGPVIEYVRARLAEHPRDLIQIIVPRVISTSVWDRFFLHHSTPRVISSLRHEPGVLISEAPYRLGDDD